MSAMSRSSTPHKTKFAYTRLPISVTHQPVPPNARIALKTSKPATMNITTAAKVNMPGLRVVDRLFDFLRFRPDLLLHLLLRTLCLLLDRPLDRRLADYYQGRVALVEHLADLLEVRAGHAPVQVADEGAGSRPYQPADQDGRREDHADRRADRQTGPAAVLGGLLGLVDYLYLPSSSLVMTAA